MNETKKKKRGLPLALTIVAYALIIVVLLAVAPVLCPAVFGYQTRLVGSDQSGKVGTKGTVVYAKEVDSIQNGNLIAIDLGKDDKSVLVNYVAGEETDGIMLEGGEKVEKDAIVGKIAAKTPFIGYLCQLCFSVIGIIILVLVFLIALAMMIIANGIAKKENQKAMNQDYSS